MAGGALIVGLLLIAALVGASIGQAASDYVASRVRYLPFAFWTSSQNDQVEKTYTANPLDGQKVAPVDEGRLPAK